MQNPLLINIGDGDAKRKLKANRPLREDWRQKSKPIPPGAVYPAKDHCRYASQKFNYLPYTTIAGIHLKKYGI